MSFGGLDSCLNENTNVGTCTLQLGDRVFDPSFHVVDHTSHLESNKAEDVASDSSSRVAYASTVKSVNVPRDISVRRSVEAAYMVHHVKARQQFQDRFASPGMICCHVIRMKMGASRRSRLALGLRELEMGVRCHNNRDAKSLTNI